MSAPRLVTPNQTNNTLNIPPVEKYFFSGVSPYRELHLIAVKSPAYGITPLKYGICGIVLKEPANFCNELCFAPYAKIIPH